MAGVSLADIADLLGHKDLATTQIYAKVQQEHLRSVVGKLTASLPGAKKSDASLKRVTQGDEASDDDQKLFDGWRVAGSGRWDGGESGIRTHVPLTGQDAFEAPPLRPLRYLSGSCA